MIHGLVLGKFLPYHAGHAHLIRAARAQVDALTVLVCSLPDFEAIAWGQATREDEAALAASRVLLCDTELHTTCTWSDLVAGARPGWLTDAARARRYELVLLLDDDVPWVDDGTRVLRARRAEHTARLRDELAAAGRTVVPVGGGHEARFAIAVAAVESVLAARPAPDGAGTVAGAGAYFATGGQP